LFLERTLHASGLDFFGDEIESVCTFDPAADQPAHDDRIDGFTFPASESLLSGRGTR
jgi:hypothetical protein